MEAEIGAVKRELREELPAIGSKRPKSPVLRSLGNVQLGVGVPLNPDAPPLPPPPPVPARSFEEALALFDGSTASAAAKSAAAPATGPVHLSGSIDEMYEQLEAAGRREAPLQWR